MATFMAPLRTEASGFVLRAYRPGDGVALGRAVSASYEHLVPFLAWPRPQPDPVADELDARRMAAHYLLGSDFPMGVWTPGESRLLGGTGFHVRGGSTDAASAEIGMWVHVDHAGRGLGARILETMVAWGFTAWPWERLSWFCRTDNPASAAVARKGGFRHEGTLRGVPSPDTGQAFDLDGYALTRDEWAATVS